MLCGQAHTQQHGANVSAVESALQVAQQQVLQLKADNEAMAAQLMLFSAESKVNPVELQQALSVIRAVGSLFLDAENSIVLISWYSAKSRMCLRKTCCPSKSRIKAKSYLSFGFKCSESHCIVILIRHLL